MTITELITALERAERPSPELDLAIGLAVYPNTTGNTVYPFYTSSIDAALTLVTGPTWRVALVERPNRRWGASILRVLPDDGECPEIEAPTPALALCIAALKART